MKHIYIPLALLFLFFSCTKDDSTGIIHTISEITITDETKELNVDFGFELVRQADATQTLSEFELKYEWAAAPYKTDGTLDTLKVISKEQTLHHVFKQRGKHYLRLKVYNIHEAVFKEYTVWVNAAFEEGVMLLAEDENGEGNLSFLKTLTPEEVEAGVKEKILEHCFSTVNPGVDMKKPVGFVKMALDWQGRSSKFIMAMSDKIYFADPQTLDLIGTTPINGEFEGEKAMQFVASDYFGCTPFIRTATGNVISIDKNYQFLFKKNGIIYNTIYEGMVTQLSIASGNSGINITPYFIDWETSLVMCPSMNVPYCTSQEMFKEENIITIFQRNGGYGSNSAYSITQAKENNQEIIIRELTQKYASDYSHAYFAQTEGGTNFRYTLSADDKIPEIGTQLVGCETYAMALWYEQNKIYAWNYLNPSPKFPNTNKWVINVGDDKEITYMAVSTNTDYLDKWLYVGVYDPTTKRGSLYIYDAAKIGNVSDLQPEKTFENQTDRIKFITDKTR